MSLRRVYSSMTGIVIACLFATESSSTNVNAQELLGAKAAMQRVRDQAKQEEAADTSELDKLIRELPKRLETLAPEDAAATWIEAYEQWESVPQQVRLQGGSQTSFSDLLNALPAPDAWPELVQMIEARPIEGSEEAKLRALGLRMLGHRLTQQKDKLNQDVEQALKLVEPQKKVGKGGLGALLGKIFRGPDVPDYRKQNWLTSVMAIKTELNPESAADTFRSQLASQKTQFLGFLSVPNLVRLVGKEEATKLLEEVLLLKNVSLHFESQNNDESGENETVKLAREIARKNLSELTRPHWELCQSTEAIDLFEAFSAMPKDENAMYFNNEKESATVWYIMGLILRDRSQDVVHFLAESQEDEKTSGRRRFATHLRYTILPYLERAGHAHKVQTFLADVLKAHPELPLWEIFVESSAKLGQSKQVLSMVETAIANPNLSKQSRRRLEKIRADALLAADQIEEGVAQSFKLLTEESDEAERSGYARVHLALRAAEIGRLLERDDWLRQASSIAEELLSESEQTGQFSEFIGLLIELKQFARAERLAVESLTRAVAEQVKEAGAEGQFAHIQRRGVVIGDLLKVPQIAVEDGEVEAMLNDFSFAARGLNNDSSLKDLLRVYYAAGRPDDVMALLEEAPWWSQTDIGEMLSEGRFESAGHGERPVPPVALIAARTLATLGRKEEARRIAEAMVFRSPNVDAGWQLALELTGDEFVPLAEKVFARDRFEERPLIWLAQYHLNKDDLAKAEELAKQAIAIDPSDGEQGRGDRMRVYAILAEILKKKGDTKTSAIYEGAVKAIRLAEHADEFYHAGMLSRGIRMYRTSLTLFADAYCIQSRLAVQLAETGDFEGAARHYQRAFELMPDSFGRVESHCFGCEGVFKGPIAEKIAERVFSKLAADQPQNPRVHYLLGYLRESESRHASAVKELQEAVRLDPDYLNAWEKLLSSAAQVDGSITPEERDNAIFQILRLDPLGLHTHADISKVQDLSRLWTVLHENARRIPPLESQPLFALKAAKTSRAKANMDDEIISTTEITAHRTAFASHGILNAILVLIQSTEVPNFAMGID